MSEKRSCFYKEAQATTLHIDRPNCAQPFWPLIESLPPFHLIIIEFSTPNFYIELMKYSARAQFPVYNQSRDGVVNKLK